MKQNCRKQTDSKVPKHIFGTFLMKHHLSIAKELLCFFLIHFSANICMNQAILRDRKSTRLNSSHVSISYAVFCLKKKKCYETQIRAYHIMCKCYKTLS